MTKRDPRLARAGVSGFNKAKRTPGHPTKSHIVVAKQGDKIKTIRFGQQGKKVGTVKGTAGAPKKGESQTMKNKRNKTTPGQRIKQLKEQLRRATDDIEREGINQSIEHWNRVQNNRRDAVVKQ